MRTTLALVARLIVVAATGCGTSHIKRVPNRVGDEARWAALADDVDYVSEVKFEKGSSVLSDAHKTQLHQMVEKARSGRKIEKVQVLSWADLDNPNLQDPRLSKAQRILAAERARSVETFIKDSTRGPKSKRIPILTYNMADHPGQVTKLFQTADPRMKRNMQQAGIPEDAQIRHANDLTSKTVILIMTQ